MNSRRKFFTSVMAVIMLTFGLVTKGQSQGRRPAERALEGTWRVTVMLGPNRPPGVPETVEALATYAAGGGYIFTDNDDPTSGHGSWEFAGPGKFNATHIRFIFDPQHHLVATLKVQARITLNSSQDEYTTEEVVEIRSFPSGDPIATFTGATAVGRRIRVEPIE